MRSTGVSNSTGKDGAWFTGGLHIVDIADPGKPKEVGCFIPEASGGRAGPHTNDIDLDERGLIYVVDRGPSFDVLEFNRKLNARRGCWKAL